VNLVLITEPEVSAGLPLADARTTHLLGTVGLRVGQTFHVGIAGGLRGLATVAATAPVLRFSVVWEKSVQARLPLTVLIGLPRPQTAKKVLHDLASLGADRLIFFEADKGDPGYLASSLWKDSEYLDALRKGTEQACSTLVPEVVRVASLAEALAQLPAEGWKVALDPYEATGALGESTPSSAHAGILAIGPERGWSDKERTLLRAQGFAVQHLGDRILRVEAACLVGGGLMLAQLRAWQAHRALG
jgi:RsmE family RNA methyltransferase